MCVRENIMTVASKLNFYFIIIRYTMATATIYDLHQGRNVINTSVSWCMECEEDVCTECT
jgi:hypothetical protein